VIPGRLLITGITNSFPMQVTFTNSIYNSYVVGQKVCLTVPASYGMIQANELTAQIIAINSNVFSLNVDSTGFDRFVTPTTYQPQPASLSPAGSQNLIFNNGDSFVPFQSLNNEGN
jgi:hypothetical protein